ncbi:unnamed protein product [Lepeophtheirus salmonis]|uniref:(salmon louse) hypothetical protein n=1 Tax=Lepeophtheirus salmonis TaxID=72036 RepID=A0A817FAK9_LEPSM|nr:unnamed protein product [Lepeophtheirus salmonis]CAG9475243.1 unnamed protein product [Lepeophtheirus salmonis]
MVPNLMKDLIMEFNTRLEKSENKRDSYPRRMHLRAISEKQVEIFPNIMAYKQVWDKSRLDTNPEMVKLFIKSVAICQCHKDIVVFLNCDKCPPRSPRRTTKIQCTGHWSTRLNTVSVHLIRKKPNNAAAENTTATQLDKWGLLIVHRVISCAEKACFEDVQRLIETTTRVTPKINQKFSWAALETIYHFNNSATTVSETLKVCK